MTTLTIAAGYSLSGVANWIKKINAKMAHRRAVRQAVKDLSSLSDYELNDIGISRGDIRAVANGDTSMKRGIQVHTDANTNLKGWV